MNERASHYRKMAKAALEHAETATNAATRASYLDLARSWHALAVQVEEKQRPGSFAGPRAHDARSGLAERRRSG